MRACPEAFRADRQGHFYCRRRRKLYGSVTSKDVAEALKEQFGIDIDKRKIVMDGNIRQFGTYQLDVKLYPEISGKINLGVAERGRPQVQDP